MDAIFRTGMWLAGRWCSIRLLLSVKPVRKVDKWRQVKVAMEANRRRVKKVFGLVEAFMWEDEGVGGLEDVSPDSSVTEEVFVGKGKVVETKTLRKEEKEK